MSLTASAKSALGSAVKIGVTVVIIVFLLARVDLGLMARHLAAANAGLLLLALGLYSLAIVLGAVKWQVLVRAQGIHVPLGNLLTYSLVGLFFGNLLPSNIGGDVVRAFDLVRATGRSEASAISVLVDRLMGLVAFLGAAVVMATLAAMTLTRGAEMEQIEIATVVAAGLFILACALMFSRRVAGPLLGLFDLGPLRRIKPVAERVYHALQVYRHSYRALATNVLLSTVIVVITTLVWYTVAVALGSDVSLFYFFLFNPLIAFVLLIPISFNGLGPKEATAIFFFGLAGMPGEVALSMSLIFHLLILLTSLPGGFMWWHERALAPSQAPPGV